MSGNGIGLPGNIVLLVSAGVDADCGASLADGALDLTPGSDMPGGGGAGWKAGLLSCAKAGEASAAPSTTSKATVFMMDSLQTGVGVYQCRHHG
jgi:hypothetical protein